MGKVKEIEIKNRTYYFYNDIINTEEFDSNLLKIDKKSHKHIDIYYIAYIAIKKIDDCEDIYCVNPLYLITGKVDGHIECNSVERSSAEEIINIQFLIQQMKTKKYLKSTQNFGM